VKAKKIYNDSQALSTEKREDSTISSAISKLSEKTKIFLFPSKAAQSAKISEGTGNDFLRDRHIQFSPKLFEACLEWRTLYDRKGFSSYRTANNHLGMLIDKIEKVSNCEEQMLYIENLLLKQSSQKKLKETSSTAAKTPGLTPIYSVHLKDRLINLWCQGALSHFGLDDGSVEFLNSLKPVIIKIRDRAGQDYKRSWFKLLAQTLQSQRELSQFIKNSIPSTTTGLSYKALIDQILSGGILQSLNIDETTRQLTIDYLVADSQIKLSSFLSDLMTHLKLLELKELQQFHHQELEYRMLVLHENFWNIPAAIRSLVLYHLLFPAASQDIQSNAGSASARQIQQEEEIFNLILDKVFPLTKKHSQTARLYITRYRKALPASGKFQVLSALLEAAKFIDQDGGEISIALARLISTLGPAEKKIVKVAGNFFPTDLFAGLQQFDQKIPGLTRWEIFDLIDENVPQIEQQYYLRFGKLLCSSPFFVNIEVESEQGSDILQLLRQNCEKKIETAFQRMSIRINRLAQQENISEILREILTEAKSEILKEIDFTNAAELFKKSDQHYQQTQLTIPACSEHDQITLIYQAPKLRCFGPRFRRVERLSGDNFKDISNPILKRIAAKSNLTLVFSNILSGRCFNRGVFSSNCLISSRISYINPSELLSEPPADSDLLALGRLIVKTLLKTTSLSNFLDKLFYEIAELRCSPELIPALFTDVQKVLQGLRDEIAELNYTDFQQVLASVSQEIHPKVLKGIVADSMSLLLSGSSARSRIAEAKQLLLESSKLPLIKVKRTEWR
jgi:hypothetical protein